MGNEQIDPFSTLRFVVHDVELHSNTAPQPVVRKLPEGVILSPEERLVLFLIVYKLHAEGSDAVEWSVHQIAQLSDSNIASVARLLKKLRLWELIATNPIGRISHASRVPKVLTSDFLHLLRQRQPSFHVPKLQPLQKKILLPAEGFNADKQKRGGFSRSNRWLLCVLLEFADDLGVVHCLSNPLLMSLTGMTRTRLRTQLNHLQCLGFVHSVSPGTKNKNFLGTQWPAYHLNIMHPYYKAARPPGLTLLMRYLDIDHYNELTDIERLQRTQDKITRIENPVASLESVRSLDFFKVTNLTGIRHQSADFVFLEGLISRLATEVLNKHWTKLNNNTLELSDINLYQSIQIGLAVELDDDCSGIVNLAT
ncbi:hypothetical protein LH51_01020 [Nitrincola sp. A-D6]|uniref:hypothetical protein n=1 Tax=Nitrincola sp. A-D6 TaxID=1545442 RepID=UPI00051FE789|nr:hypothetical protein [Nitrincola sp. A-D6]KGK43251.1 hypothetical protein LH51_01020 [Nitrincola sp. A-D6]